jgi:phage baseplate assembly protein W
MGISFKNVGIRKEDLQNNTLAKNKSQMPIGIKTPMVLSTRGPELVEMHFDITEQIKDNLKNLLLTNHGDRVIQYNFGANIRPLLSEWYNKENFDNEAMININTAVSKFMPFLSLTDYESKTIKSESSITYIKIKITYSVPLLNIQNQEMDLDLALI